MSQNLSRRQLLAGLASACASAPWARAQSSPSPLRRPEPAPRGGPLRVAFVYVTPVGATGWTAQHERGRVHMQQVLGHAVHSRFIANVPEGPDAERVVSELAHQGEQLIFTTSFGYMESVMRVAGNFPRTVFEQCSGYKLAANVGAYNGRFYQGRYLAGMVAAHMSRTGVAGMVASFPIPEVIQGINAFTLGMRAVNRQARMKVVWVNTWYDPGREADAARALVGQGADVLTHHTNSPAAVQVAEEKGCWAVGYCSDEAAFAPRAQLTAVTLHWGDFYVRTAQDVLAGRWRPQSVWDGIAQGFVRLAPFGIAVPERVRRQVVRAEQDIVQGQLHPFSGRILDNRGKLLFDGVRMSDGQIQRMDRYVMGVEGDVPRL